MSAMASRFMRSPRGGWAIHTATAWGTPATTDLVRLPSHQVVRTLVTNEALKATLAGLRQGKSEFFQVDIGNRVALDGWMMFPPDFDATKKYPLLVLLHGGLGALEMFGELPQRLAAGRQVIGVDIALHGDGAQIGDIEFAALLQRFEDDPDVEVLAERRPDADFNVVEVDENRNTETI